MKMNNILWCFAGIGLFLGSCSDFLDVKPDKKMAVPSTMEHVDLLLNDYSAMNTGFPSFGEIAADDYYLNTENWQSLSDMDDRNLYVWNDEDIVGVVQWQNPYRTVYRANQALAVLQRLGAEQHTSPYERLVGGAHFYRAFALHQLVAIFTPPYQQNRAHLDLGLPLRLVPDLDKKSVRASLSETYQQIILDYLIAIRDLPEFESTLGRPGKAAAYAGLSRLYLDMSDFENAFVYADSCLQQYDNLLDYNAVNVNASLPFTRFNVEVLFPAVSVISGALGQAFARIDSNLYDSYADSDLRKSAFFRHNSAQAGTYAFKGSYNATTSGVFVGLTTGEILLVRAEAAARLGYTDIARNDINLLLKHRWKTEDFTPVELTDNGLLLELILQERRKELVFRGRRWSDLRRLNQESRFAKELIRNVGGEQFSLKPNARQYALKIPQIVITESGISQNER